jgi:hypothetical protein
MEKTFKTTDVNELKEMLKKDIIEFEFIKKDGSVRTAKGTLMAEHLPAPKADSKPHKQNDNVLVYFDLDKQSWRSFVKESFVGAY